MHSSTDIQDLCYLIVSLPSCLSDSLLISIDVIYFWYLYGNFELSPSVCLPVFQFAYLHIFPVHDSPVLYRDLSVITIVAFLRLEL